VLDVLEDAERMRADQDHHRPNANGGPDGTDPSGAASAVRPISRSGRIPVAAAGVLRSEVMEHEELSRPADDPGSAGAGPGEAGECEQVMRLLEQRLPVREEARRRLRRPDRP
jgi:hypothetical protein